MAHTYDPRIQKIEAEESVWVDLELGLHSEFQNCLAAEWDPVSNNPQGICSFIQT